MESTTAVETVMKQTNYTEQEAQEQLLQHRGDAVEVIRCYLGIPAKPVVQARKTVNQEKYRQIRSSLDQSMATYRQAHPIDLQQVRDNFMQESKR